MKGVTAKLSLGLAFFQFGAAVLFAFFKKTEVIALDPRFVDRTDHPDGGDCADSAAGRDVLPCGDGERQGHHRLGRGADLPNLHGERAVLWRESGLEVVQPPVQRLRSGDGREGLHYEIEFHVSYFSAKAVMKDSSLNCSSVKVCISTRYWSNPPGLKIVSSLPP